MTFHRPFAVSLLLPVLVAALPIAARAQVSVAWSQFERGVAIAVDRNDAVYTLDYEQQLGAEVVVTKRDALGNLLWTSSFDQTDATKWERAQWLATDSQGDVIVCATLMSGYSNPVVAASLVMKFDAGCIVRKLGPTGALLWQNAYPVAGMRVEVGPDDAAIVAGFPNQGTAGAAFCKVDAGGALLWSNLDADGPLMLLMHAQLLVFASGDAYLAAGTLFDMAVCKVSALGVSQWTATTPGANAAAIAFSRASNGVFVVGGRTAHLLDATEGQWQELGGALAGTNGTPRLAGQGRCAQGQPMALYGSHAAPNAVVVHVVGLSAVGVPLFGGLLVPSPDLLHVALTDAVGRSGFGLTIPTAVGPGQSLWFQTWCLDAGAIAGFSASSAQRVRGS